MKKDCAKANLRTARSKNCAREEAKREQRTYSGGARLDSTLFERLPALTRFEVQVFAAAPRSELICRAPGELGAEMEDKEGVG